MPRRRRDEASVEGGLIDWSEPARNTHVLDWRERAREFGLLPDAETGDDGGALIEPPERLLHEEEPEALESQPIDALRGEAQDEPDERGRGCRRHRPGPCLPQANRTAEAAEGARRAGNRRAHRARTRRRARRDRHRFPRRGGRCWRWRTAFDRFRAGGRAHPAAGRRRAEAGKRRAGAAGTDPRALARDADGRSGVATAPTGGRRPRRASASGAKSDAPKRRWPRCSGSCRFARRWSTISCESSRGSSEEFDRLTGDRADRRRAPPRAAISSGAPACPARRFRERLRLVREHEARVADAKRELLEANLRLVVSIAKRYAQPRPVAARSDSGRQHRPDEGGRSIPVPARVQVLDLRHLVDPPGDRRAPSPTTAARSGCRCTSSNRSTGSTASARALARGTRPRADTRRARRADEAAGRQGAAAARGREACRRRWKRRWATTRKRRSATLVRDPSARSPEEAVINGQMAEEVERAMAPLNDREREVLRLRYGLGTDRELTLAEIGRRLSIYARAGPPNRGQSGRQDASGARRRRLTRSSFTAGYGTKGMGALRLDSRFRRNGSFSRISIRHPSRPCATSTRAKVFDRM